MKLSYRKVKPYYQHRTAKKVFYIGQSAYPQLINKKELLEWLIETLNTVTHKTDEKPSRTGYNGNSNIYSR